MYVDLHMCISFWKYDDSYVCDCVYSQFRYTLKIFSFFFWDDVEIFIIQEKFTLLSISTQWSFQNIIAKIHSYVSIYIHIYSYQICILAKDCMYVHMHMYISGYIDIHTHVYVDIYT